MKVFKISYRDKAGKVSTERVEAETQSQAVDLLASRGMLTLSVAEEQTAHAAGKSASKPKRVKNEEVVIFVRQFATMIDAGLPMLQCLQTLQEQQDQGALRDVLTVLVEDVNRGRSLSEALANFPKTFDKLFISMVRAGEAGGFLAEILEKLAVYLESSAALRRKVKSAMMYPLVVSIIALLVTALLMVKVVPQFVGIFDGVGLDLPLPTKMLIATSNFLKGYGGLVVLGAMVAAIFAFRAYNNTPAGRMNIDKLKFKLPVFGVLVQKVAIARFTSTLATLVSSGVPIISSLGIVSEASGNEVINKILKEARANTEKGEPIAVALRDTPYIPRMVAKMIEVGEATGRLDQMLSRIASYYTEQVNVAVAGLTSMIEPLLILFLGVVVGGIMLAMFMPIFKMTSNM